MAHKLFKILNDFILEHNLTVELLPNTFYSYKAKFKPEKTLMLKKENMSISIAFNKEMFSIPDSQNADKLVSELKQKLIEGGFTYIH